MINPFVGGILFHPAALDYTDQTCSHGCAYCFASINKADRGGSIKSAINTLYNRKSPSLANTLFSYGYPVCVSNRTDSFAANNRANAEALFTHLAEIPHGVFIQTKGGARFMETFDLLQGKQNVVIYITITTLDAEIAARVEGAAPAPMERLAIAKALVDQGYLVIAAINPCSKAWLPAERVDDLMAAFKDHGIRHVVVEMLDMSTQRQKKLNPQRAERMADAWATVGSEDQMHVRWLVDRLMEKGFIVGKKGMPFATSFWDDIAARLGRVMPTYQEFVNYCFKKHPNGGPVTLGEMMDVFNFDLADHYQANNEIRGYLLRAGFKTWRAHKKVYTFRELLRILWNDHRSKYSIQRHCLFQKTDAVDLAGNCKLLFTNHYP